MLKAIILTVAMWLLFVSSGLSMSISKRGQVQVCGRALAETLNLLCEGQYYDPEEEESNFKRHLQPQVGAKMFGDWYFGVPPGQVLRSISPESKLPSNRQQRGVVDECCKQSCTPSVLLSYCRPRK